MTGSFSIAGINQETTVSMTADNGKFVYTVSRQATARCRSISACCRQHARTTSWKSHGSLPNNSLVGRATHHLRNSRRFLLPTQWTTTRGSRTVREKEDAHSDQRKNWNRTSARMRVLEGMLTMTRGGTGKHRPPQTPAAPPPPVAGRSHVIMGFGERRPIEIRLAKGNITDVNARAIVLGVFKNVEPAGPAIAIDARLNGAVREFTRRRMFKGDVGEVFVTPTNRSQLRVFVQFRAVRGPRQFRHLQGRRVDEFVAQYIVRTFVRTQVEDFATVIWARARASPPLQVYQLRGDFKGMADADRERELRRITFCMRDPDKYRTMRAALLQLTGTTLFDDVEATITEIEPAETPVAEVTKRAITMPQRTRLPCRQRTCRKRRGTLAGGVAPHGRRQGDDDHRRAASQAELLSAQLNAIEYNSFTYRGMRRYGERLGTLLLDESIRTAALKTVRANHLIVVHDSPSEVFVKSFSYSCGFSAAEAGLSRRYAGCTFQLPSGANSGASTRRSTFSLSSTRRRISTGRIVKVSVGRPLSPTQEVQPHEFAGDAATLAVVKEAFQSGSTTCRTTPATRASMSTTRRAAAFCSPTGCSRASTSPRSAICRHWCSSTHAKAGASSNRIAPQAT